MFLLISLLYFVLSILLYQTIDSNRKFFEFTLITFVFYIIIAYIFYMYNQKKEEFEEIEQLRSNDTSTPVNDEKNENETKEEKRKRKKEKEKEGGKEGGKEDERKANKKGEKGEKKANKKGKKKKINENKKSISCEDNPQLTKACEDKWKGYIPHSALEKLNKIPEKLNKDILPPLKSISQNQTVFTSDNATTQNIEKDNDNVFLDMMHIQENPEIYSKLKVLKNNASNSKDFNIDNIDLKKMDIVSKKMEKINYVLFAFKKYSPELYSKIKNTFL